MPLTIIPANAVACIALPLPARRPSDGLAITQARLQWAAARWRAAPAAVTVERLPTAAKFSISQRSAPGRPNFVEMLEERPGCITLAAATAVALEHLT